MPCDVTEKIPGLKAIVLVGMNEPYAGGSERPPILWTLGGRKVIDHITEHVSRIISPDDIHIVVAGDEDLVSRVRACCHCTDQMGKQGDRDLAPKLRSLLNGYNGDLLVLHDDAPLLSPSTMRGLINRHSLRQADLTLLSSIVGYQVQRNSIIRDQSGEIIDVAEEVGASETREMAVGAYVIRAEAVMPFVGKWVTSLSSDCGLDSLPRLLVRSGLHVESYQTYDEDEVLALNTSDDLIQAEHILQKRRSRQENSDLVIFRGGSWLATIGEGFTLRNVRRLSQALANEVTRSRQESTVIIGHDSRFLSEQAAEAAAEVFAGNNIQVVLLAEAASTPLIAYATRVESAAYGLAFTASHNPPEWNGLKVFQTDGSLLPDDESRWIEAETEHLTPDQAVNATLDLAQRAHVIHRQDYTNRYVDAVESRIDLDVIRRASLKVIVDPMHGVGDLPLGMVLAEARCRVNYVHDRRDPLFGGRAPVPNRYSLRLLIDSMQEENYHLGIATDGDADRMSVVDQGGEYITPNDILLLLYWYLHEVRGERGPVVRNLATTHLLDRLAASLGEACFEVPVGFGYLATTVTEHNALLGGESNGGYSFRGHIPHKDGILASAMVVEMLARTGCTISELRQRIWQSIGRLYALEVDIPATQEMRTFLPQRLRQAQIEQIGPYPVLSASHLGSTKLLLEHDNWALLRFSGSEPLLRLYAEADTLAKAQEIIEWLKAYVTQ